MKRLVAILFGMALYFLAMPYAMPETIRGFAHVCSPDRKLCTAEANGGAVYGTNGIAFITATNTTTSTASATGTGTGSNTVTLANISGTVTLTFNGTTSATGTGLTTYIWTSTSTSTVRLSVVTQTNADTYTKTTSVVGTQTATRYGNTGGPVTVTITATVTGTSGQTAIATATRSSAIGGGWPAYGTQTAIVTLSSTSTSTYTQTSTGTACIVVVGTGTGTSLTGDTPPTVTGTASANSTATFSGTANGTATLTGSSSGTVTGTVTDTSSATATSATLPTTITYDSTKAVVPGGDLFATSGFNAGNYLAFHPTPQGEAAADIVAHPTVGSPDTLTGSNSVAPYGCFDNTIRSWCSLVNKYLTTSSPTWISPGEIKVWVWATATSDAQIKVFFDGCTGGNPAGYFNPPTITFNVVATSGWQQLYATIALPNGLLLPANYQLCVSMYAYTSSGTPTVTLGATSPHYTRINGPWVPSGSNGWAP